MQRAAAEARENVENAGGEIFGEKVALGRVFPAGEGAGVVPQRPVQTLEPYHRAVCVRLRGEGFADVAYPERVPALRELYEFVKHISSYLHLS